MLLLTMQSIFQFLDYRRYLSEWVAEHPKGGRGSGKRIAEELNCEPAFISRVLHGASNLSLEQAVKLNLFLEHSPDETDYFLLLVQYERAGSELLRNHYRTKIEAAQAKRLVFRNRVESGKIVNDQDRMTYYSAWHYGAIRVLLGIPEIRTKQQLVRYLKLPADVIYEALDFLVSCGLVVQEGDSYLPGVSKLHLGKSESPLVNKHHTNWRIQAMRALDYEREQDVHFSMGMAISREDAVRLKAMVVDFLESATKVVDSSSPEAFYGICLDFFEA